jgi:hypothetical protein
MGNADTGKSQSKVKLVWQPRGKGFDMSPRKFCCRHFVWDAFHEVLTYATKGKDMW